MKDEKYYRDQMSRIPTSDLEFNMSMTEPVWGKNEVNPDLQDALTKKYFEFDMEGNLILDQNGQPKLSKKALWSMLGFFTRDMRLSNLSPGNLWKGEPDEIGYCKNRLDLANDLLSEGYEECFQICLERVASLLELAQSKKGFLRIKMNTYTQENVTQTNEPPKRSFVGGGMPK